MSFAKTASGLAWRTSVLVWQASKVLKAGKKQGCRHVLAFGPAARDSQWWTEGGQKAGEARPRAVAAVKIEPVRSYAAWRTYR